MIGKQNFLNIASFQRTQIVIIKNKQTNKQCFLKKYLKYFFRNINSYSNNLNIGKKKSLPFLKFFSLLFNQFPLVKRKEVEGKWRQNPQRNEKNFMDFEDKAELFSRWKVPRNERIKALVE